MTLHAAEVHLTLNPAARLHVPGLRSIDEAMRVHPSRLAELIARPFLAPLRAFGLDIVRRDGLELLEYTLKRGVIAGGSQMGNYLETEVMEHIFRNASIFAAPANVYVALWTATTGEADDSGTEVSGGSYARVAVNTTSGWNAVSDGATDNASDVTFATATANWGTVTDVTLEAAASAISNRFFYGTLSSSKTVNDGDSFKFATGALDVSVA